MYARPRYTIARVHSGSPYENINLLAAAPPLQRRFSLNGFFENETAAQQWLPAERPFGTKRRRGIVALSAVTCESEWWIARRC